MGLWLEQNNKTKKCETHMHLLLPEGPGPSIPMRQGCPGSGIHLANVWGWGQYLKLSKTVSLP